jgi:hypothetical protein
MTAVAIPAGFSGLCDELKTEALNAWENLKSKGEAEVQLIAKGLGPVIVAEAATVLSQFKSVAISTVMMLAQAEYANLTGAQKNGITANTILQAAAASGKALALDDAKTLAQGAFDALTATAPGA